jgi:hypothetical protein
MSRKSKKDRQHNDKNKKDKRTNNELDCDYDKRNKSVVICDRDTLQGLTKSWWRS